MHRPTDLHWKTVKRVLRYLAGTTNYGIFLSSTTPLTVHAYSDEDWAGDADDYISTNAYVIYIGGSPFHGPRKKNVASQDH